MKKRLLVGAILLIGLGGLAAVKLSTPKPLVLETSFEFPIGKAVAPFSLVNQDNQEFTNSNLQGKWSLFFVGYTSCPDVCPTTMAKLSALYPSLAELGPIQIVFLSVDPQRDTPEKLKSYVQYFNPNFVAVTGSHAQLQPIVRSLGMVYAMVGDGDDYQVDHSTSLILVSPLGEKVAVVKPTAEPGNLPQIRNQSLLADVTKIISKNSF